MSAPAVIPVPAAQPPAPGGPVTLEDSFSKAQAALDAARTTAPADVAALADEVEDPTPPAAQVPSKVPAPGAEAPKPDAAADPKPGDTPPADAAADPAAPKPADAPEMEVVAIAGRRPEDPPFEIEVPKGEVAELLRQNVNNGIRGAEFDQMVTSLDAERLQVQQDQDRLEVDPVGYLTPTLAPPDRADVVLQMLADPDVLAEAAEKLAELLDPDSREDAIKDIQIKRLKSERGRAEMLRERSHIRRARNEIFDIITALTPPTLNEEQARLFQQDAINQVRAAVNASENGLINPLSVPKLLKPRLEMFGMTEQQIAEAVLALSQRGPRRGRRPLAPTPPPPPPTPAPPARVVARVTPQQLEAGQQNRDKLRAPPPGAGAPSPAREVPRGLTIEAAVEALQAQRKARPA